MSTQIEWTDETWNPAVGCERVSPGCDNCYAVRVAHREMQPAHVGLTGYDDSGERRPGPYWTGEVRLLPERLEEPLRWRKPRRVFVGSMTDLFHPAVPDSFLAAVFGVMAAAPQHTFQILTKRPQRLARMADWLHENGASVARMRYEVLDAIPNPLPNVWLGTSVENQRYADLRIPHLLATPAAIRFLSIEPLLGPVDLEDISDARSGAQVDALHCDEGPEDAGWIGTGTIDWVIVGGESGPGARPMHPAWARSLRDQCVAARVPFFFKQWGEWSPSPWPGARATAPEACWVQLDGETRRAPSACPAEGAAPMWRVGKKSAGRELDGGTWSQMPDRWSA